MPERTESGGRTRTGDRRLLAGGVFLAALLAAGGFLPRDPDFDLWFGVESFRTLGFAAYAAAALALFAVLALPGVAGRIASAAVRAAPRGPAGPVALAAAFAAAAWLLPNHTLSGDAGSVVLQVGADRIFPSNALTGYAFRAVDRLLGADPVTTVRLVSVLSGAVYALAAVGIGREAAPPGPRRAGVVAVLLGTGTVALFFGTIEVYAPLVALVAVYLLAGLRRRNGRDRAFVPPLVLGVAAGFHGSALVLVPSLVLLENGGRLRPPWPARRLLLDGALVLLPLAATAGALWLGEWGGRPPSGGAALYGTVLGTEGEGPFVPLVRGEANPSQPYAILDPEHVVGLANLYLLVAPVGLLLLVLGPRPVRDARFRFVLAAAAGFLFLTNVWNVSFPLRRDWDLLSSVGPPLALAGALAWFSRERSGADVVRVVALSLFATVPFLVAHHVRSDARFQYQEHLGQSLEWAVPDAAAGEIVDLVAARSRQEEFEPARELPGFPRRIRGAVQDALVGSGALERRQTSLDPVRFRAAVRRELPAGAEGLADRATARLAALFRGLAEEGRKAPAPGVLAALVAEGVDPDVELDLLDALDAAMAAGDGFYRRRETPPYGEWEAALGESFSRLWPEAPPERIRRAASFVAVAAGEVLDPERGRPGAFRWTRIDEASRARFARARALSFPGRDPGLDRVRWEAEREDRPPAERGAAIVRWARHALGKVPWDGGWWHALGEGLALEGRTREAIAAFRRELEIYPPGLNPRLSIARLLHAAGRTGEAIDVLSYGLRFDMWNTDLPEAYLLLARMRFERGEVDLARAHLRLVVDLVRRRGREELLPALREKIERIEEEVAR